jgi:hypothetical protein
MYHGAGQRAGRSARAGAIPTVPAGWRQARAGSTTGPRSLADPPQDRRKSLTYRLACQHQIADPAQRTGQEQGGRRRGRPPRYQDPAWAKRNLSVGLGLKGIETGYRVLFTTAAAMIAVLTKATAEGRLEDKLKSYTVLGC